MAADVFALHSDQQHPRVADLEAVERAIIPRFAVTENHRKCHAKSMAMTKLRVYSSSPRSLRKRCMPSILSANVASGPE
jgi:hypothetical protein